VIDRARLCGLLLAILMAASALRAQAPLAAPAQTPSAAEQAPAVFSMDKDREPMVSLDGLWRFHPGDDPHWAEPDFDDSQWPLISSTQGWSEQGYKNMGGLAWYRAKIVIPQGGQPLALYIPLIRTSYQVFIDGEMIGQFGGMPPHQRHYQVIPETYPVPVSVTAQAHTAVIAIRVWHWPVWATYRSGGLQGGMLIGRTNLIDDYSVLIADRTVEQYTSRIVLAVLYTLAGLTSLALFVLRPREKEYLWFGAIQLIEVAERCFDFSIQFHAFPIVPRDQVWNFLHSADQLLYVGFYYYLLRARRGWSFWLGIGAVVAFDLFQIPVYMYWPISVAALVALDHLAYLPSTLWIDVLVIRRAIQGFRDARLVVVPQLANDLFSLAATAVVIADRMAWSNEASSFVYYFWDRPFPFYTGDIVSLLFLLAMLAILIRRFTRTSLHEERLASEMESARTVQHVLIPEEIPAVPGFAIQAVYKPASEVGGDFFQIVPAQNGGLLAVIGDVSGKGMPAAMTVSLLVGTVRTLAHYTQNPDEILHAMNQRMLARAQGGFTTCLVLRIDPDGSAAAANAGHLSPYVDGEELEIESGLPLGLAADSTYPNFAFHLAPEAQLTLMTDGVVEARNRAGELFGFERARIVAAQAPEAIAQQAQAFGQQDDITVLALSLAPSPALAIQA
jgi:stage II sporulation SpoE-like protein